MNWQQQYTTKPILTKPRKNKKQKKKISQFIQKTKSLPTVGYTCQHPTKNEISFERWMKELYKL